MKTASDKLDPDLIIGIDTLVSCKRFQHLLVTLSIRFSRNPVIVDIDRVGSFGMGGWQQL